MRVAGKRAIVLGAGSVGPGWGNGKAAAVLYAREGASVLCVDRDRAAAEETARIIRGEGGRAEVFAGDMTDPGAATSAVAAAVAAFGGLDILHYNIGISTRGGITETRLEDWQRVFAVNLDGAFLTTQAALPALEDGGGAIVYIATLAAVMNGPYPYVGYEASKAALVRLASSVAIEYAARGVRANAVLPGMIDTPHVQAMIAPGTDPATLAATRAGQVPMRRQGTAWDVAEAALFLASDAAGFITGETLRVDGGMGILTGQSER
ncbi:3-oxoacyl-[acyl-carrier protein] reductase [Rhodovulum sp. P5]|uniref:SDR family NAD(P)-dependent oxidoreductase n=1 Tax=Rhodovulum sp. P5 TaxID=1564506 RepID=UPI0009C27B74|nr:SDR family NAD(P)-dependent oxidoreductase [Rhodovulum sp. P5]ARE40357.1 3-oxoacyl-[acyl-carrier protein] reductase [Rhodovulum sp. P5]